MTRSSHPTRGVLNQTVAHVLPAVSRAGVSVDPATGRVVAAHDEAAHECIAAELVACTLGQRERLELRVDIGGRMRHAFRQLRAALAH